MDIRVTSGAETLATVSKRLKDIGDRALKNELARNIRAVTKPVIADLRQAALRTLPREGGLAARVAGSKIGTRTTTTGNNVGVRIVARSGYDLDAIDRGTLRHPVFGTDRWVTQSVPAGWWSKTLKADEAKVREAVINAVETIGRKAAP